MSMSQFSKVPDSGQHNSTQNQMVELDGRVCSGLGEGSNFIQMNWVLKQFLDKFAMKPFVGTFNLEMAGAKWQRVLARLREVEGIIIEPPEGFCSAKCFRVVLQGQGHKQVEAVVIFPAVSNYPEHKFEIVAAVPIRQVLQLKDGDQVKVQLYLN